MHFAIMALRISSDFKRGLHRQVRDDAQARRLVDELSVLYVAATRAKHRLEMIVPSPPAKGTDLTSTSLAPFVREALLEVTDPEPGEGGRLWSHPGITARVRFA